MPETFGDLSYEGPWPAELAKLRAGEPVEAYGWQLPRVGCPSTDGRYRIAPDGTVTPA
jgi:hypothetical protein